LSTLGAHRELHSWAPADAKAAAPISSDVTTDTAPPVHAPFSRRLMDPVAAAGPSPRPLCHTPGPTQPPACALATSKICLLGLVSDGTGRGLLADGSSGGVASSCGLRSEALALWEPPTPLAALLQPPQASGLPPPPARHCRPDHPPLLSLHQREQPHPRTVGDRPDARCDAAGGAAAPHDGLFEAFIPACRERRVISETERGGEVAALGDGKPGRSSAVCVPGCEAAHVVGLPSWCEWAVVPLTIRGAAVVK
jgi:hypothetical protein